MPKNCYSSPECKLFLKSQYKSYWAFLWLLNCSDQQFNDFMDTDSQYSFEEFNWAYNFLLANLCKKAPDMFSLK